MDRHQFLLLLVQQARKNGFEFRKWFRAQTMRPWVSSEDAVQWLCQGSRSHVLLFSHAFARAFFQSGKRLQYIQPAVTYERVMPDGSRRAVNRRAHTRNSSREDVWLYHLREMAAAREPLRYIRRYLLLEETLADVQTDPEPGSEAENYDDELLVRQ